MNKKFLSAILFGALAVASTGSFVSCKDYDDDIKNLQTQIGQLANKSELQSSVSTLQSAISTAQAAAENKAAAAQSAADTAKAAAEAASKAAATATDEASKAAAEAKAATAAAEAAAAKEDLAAANAKIADLEKALADVKALSETLVKTEDFDAAKKELNDKYDALKTQVEGMTGTTGLLGIQVLEKGTADKAVISVAYGIWNDANAADWKGPKAEDVKAIEKGTYLAQVGTPTIEVAFNPTEFAPSEKLDLAVSNKYGEVAPIYVGNAKKVTRASATAYSLQVKTTVDGEKAIKDFEKDFNGQAATLVAANVAAGFDNNFVSIVKAANNTKSDFSATVEYDEINGAVELVAKNPEYVIDAYISSVGDDPHHILVNSLVGKPENGLTLSYKKEAAQVYAFTNGYKLTVTVKQITINGAVKEVTAPVEFKAKYAAEPVEKEAIIAAIPHPVSVKIQDALTDEKLQKVTFTKADLLKALKYEKDSKEEIHFNHSELGSKIEVVDVYYKSDAADNDTVQISNGFITPSLKDNVITLLFAKNYGIYSYVDEDSKTVNVNMFEGKTDVVKESQTLYATLKVPAADNDEYAGTVVTNYIVTVPVEFQWVDFESMYDWKAAELTQNFNKAVVAKSAFEDYFEYYPVDVVRNAKGEPVVIAGTGTSTSNPARYTPAITVTLDYKNIESYKSTKKAYEDLKIADIITKTQLEALLLDLNNDYQSMVTVDNTTFQNATSTKSGYMYSTFFCEDEDDYDLYFTKIQQPVLTEKYTYTISGLKGKVLNRIVSLKERKVEVNKTADPTPTMTPTFAAGQKLAPKTFLYNALAAAANDTEIFAGSFNLKDVDNMPLNLSKDSKFTVSKVTWSDANCEAKINIEVVPYSYSNSINTSATATAYGILITVDGQMPTTGSVEIEFSVTNTIYAGTGLSAGTQTGVKMSTISF